jgi:aspartyl-tRNA(Asn)/glutamyl-tRNA(Gln) amidotransferase subunit C
MPIRETSAIDTAEFLHSQGSQDLARHDGAAAGPAVHINGVFAQYFSRVIEKRIDRDVLRARNMPFCKFARGPYIKDKIPWGETTGRLVEFGHGESLHCFYPTMTPIQPKRQKTLVISATLCHFRDLIRRFMVEVNEALIRKVAKLARLELKDSEIGDHVSSIAGILKHVDQLAQLDTEGVEPMLHGIDEILRLREDEVVNFNTNPEGPNKIVQSAPEVEHDGFKVPRIIG